MPDDLRTRNAPARGQVVQQSQQAVDLRGGVWRLRVVVQLDTERGGVDVGYRAPAPCPGMPGALLIGNQLIDRTVTTDQIMCAARAAAVARAQRIQAGLRRTLLGGMQHDQYWPTDIVIWRWHPECKRIVRRDLGAATKPGPCQQAGQSTQAAVDDGFHTAIVSSRAYGNRSLRLPLELQSGDMFRIGNQLDLHDAFVLDAEREHDARRPVRNPCRARHAIDQSEASGSCTTGESIGHAACATYFRRQRRRSFGLARLAGCDGSGIGPEHDIRIEQSQQGIELAIARGIEKGGDDVASTFEVAFVTRSGALYAPTATTGQLARGRSVAIDDRCNLLERHAEHVMQDKGNTFGRSQRVEHRHQRWANRVGQDRLTFGVARVVASSSCAESGSS